MKMNSKCMEEINGAYVIDVIEEPADKNKQTNKKP